MAEVDERALPLFVTARAVWFMGLYVQLAEVCGTTMVGGQFFQSGLDFITGWEARAGT